MTALAAATTTMGALATVSQGMPASADTVAEAMAAEALEAMAVAAEAMAVAAEAMAVAVAAVEVEATANRGP
jgi:hypothetical protein